MEDARVSTRMLGELLRAKRKEIENLEKNRDALDLALAELENAKKELSERFSPVLRERAQSTFDLITGGGRTLFVESVDALRMEEDGGVRDVAAFSAGTADALYLSLRLGLCDTVFGEEKPPLIFDDVFARMDDDRLSKPFSLLYKRAGTQCLLFTCSSFFARLLSEKGNRIDL